MDITFVKAPLVELIAELRWIPRGSTSVQPSEQQPLLPTIFLGGNKQEEFYARAGTALHKRGFDRSERLIPLGTPFVLHQPVYRLRSERDENRSVIYQIGYGVFSVHGVPPYHSWAKFLPFVKAGLQVLIESRPEEDVKHPFSQITLRYIDFFGQELMRGRDIPAFLSQVFGFSASLPTALANVATAPEVKSLFTKIVVPIKIGDLTVSFGDGQFNNQPGILLDTTATSSAETAPEVDAILTVFDSAHAVTHHMFLEMTKPIHEMMQLQGANGK